MPDIRPNVVIVLTDQLQRDAVGAYGSPDAQTPNIDALAADGVRFNRSYVALPVCSPSRACLMTGLYPHQHLLMLNNKEVTWDTDIGPLENRPVLPESVPSLGLAFKKTGYRTGYTGPWHMGLDNTAHHGWTDYWRTYRYWPDGRDYYVQHLESLDLAETFHREHRDFSLGTGVESGVVPSGRSEIPNEHARTSWAFDRAIEFIEMDDDRPWLFFCSIKDPHPPIISPADYGERVDPDSVTLPATLWADASLKPATLQRTQGLTACRNMTETDWRRVIADYHGLVAHIDNEFGRMLRAIEANGQADSTIVIFTSDHGEMLGAQRMMCKGPAMYEESIAVPFIARWPGRIDGGRAHDDFFSNIDILATLGALCDVPVEPGEGMDFSSTLTDGEAGGRSEIFTEWYGVGPNGERDLASIRTVRTDRWKLNLFLNDRCELFDLESDPYEATNLIDSPDHASARADLGERIIGWLRDTDDPLAPVFERVAADVAG